MSYKNFRFFRNDSKFKKLDSKTLLDIVYFGQKIIDETIVNSIYLINLMVCVNRFFVKMKILLKERTAKNDLFSDKNRSH